MAHKWLFYISERTFFFTEFFPGMPVAIAFEVGFKNIFRAIFNHKSDSGAADGIAESKDRTFKMAGFERFFGTYGNKEKMFDF